MTWLRVLLARCAGFFTQKKADRELNDEIHAHLDLLEEENRRKGMTGAEARNAALREFGGVAQMRETYRETGGIRLLESFFQDVRYGARMLRRNPGFAVTVVLLLALGIGANSAIFSGIDAIMLRLLPVKDPQQLVLLEWLAKGFPNAFMNDYEGGGGKDEASGLDKNYSFNYQTYLEIRDRNQSFSDTFAEAGNKGEVNIGLHGRAEVAGLNAVSGNFFQALRVQAVLGRTLLPSDDQENAPAVAVASYGFWQQKLGADSSIVGKPIVVNGNSMTIVGVAPPEFFGVEPGYSPDLWVPLSWFAWQWTQLGYDNNGSSLLKDRKTWWLQIGGRLKPNVNIDQASAELRVLFFQAIKLPNETRLPENKIPRLQLATLKQGTVDARNSATKPLFLLTGMVGLVLLIACANVAGLLLTRATAREKEIAVRLSLGAGRVRLVRQLLTESLLLALIGGTLALLIAWVGSKLLLQLFSGGKQIAGLEPHLNLHLLLFTAAVSILSGIIFGLMPAVRCTRVDVLGSLKQSASTSPGSGNKFVSGKILAGGQVALCLLLLITAGLFLGTLRKLQAVELGFDRQNLLLFGVRPGLNGYKDVQLSNFYLELQRRIRSIPGVRSVTFSQRGPIGEGTHSTSATIPGYTPGDKGVKLWAHTVGPDYFETLGIPVVMGRAIVPQDTGAAPHVLVVNQKVVHDVFHDDNPLGHRLNFGSGKRSAEYEVVGVVKNVKYAKLQDEVPPTVYFPYQQRPVILNVMTFEVRTAENVSALINAIQHEAQALDKDVPLVDMRSEVKVIDETLVLQRAFASVSTTFGGLALLLACVGLYGTMSYAVARRTNEIGIRMALGAERGNVLIMVLRETAVVVLIGFAAGFPLAWFATAALRSQLFGLTIHDSATMVAAIAIITAVTTLAGYIPARRASRVDPMVALRYE